MPNISRRGILKFLGGSALTLGSINTASATETTGASPADHGPTPDSQMPGTGSIEKLGHTLGSDPVGGYAEEDVRPDGKFAVVGSFLGIGGSFLFDIQSTMNPAQVHNLPSESTVRNADVAFDQRNGLYYRSQEPNEENVEFAGVEVVDYGWKHGSFEEPVIISKMQNGGTHNLFPHPEEDLLYAVRNDGPKAFWVWDVSDPMNPVKAAEGPKGEAHDFVIDPQRDIMHFSGHLELENAKSPSYVTLDAADPVNPEPVGWIDYAEYPDLQKTGFTDQTVFEKEGNHYANYDPDRMISVISDEEGEGFPAPKTTVDIGWDEGDVTNPVPLDQKWVPNAELQDELGETYDWTTHNHDIISKKNETLLVSGDYHEGTLVYNISDPRNIQVADQYYTDDMADKARGPMFFPPQSSAPMAWGANYNEKRDLTVTSDMYTGLYVFRVSQS